jgi:hypothetical protein
MPGAFQSPPSPRLKGARGRSPILSVRVCLVCVCVGVQSPAMRGSGLGVPRSRSQCKKSPAEARLEVCHAKTGTEHIPPSILLDQTQCVVVPVPDTRTAGSAFLRASPRTS